MRDAPPSLKIYKMKKSIFAFTFFCSCMLALISCGSKEIKDIKGLVADIKAVNDSLVSAKILIGGDTAIFKMTDARFINGMFMAGDSVKISYIEGRKDTLRALIVSIIPKAPHYFDAEAAKNDTRITAPAVKDAPAENDSAAAKIN